MVSVTSDNLLDTLHRIGRTVKRNSSFGELSRGEFFLLNLISSCPSVDQTAGRAGGTSVSAIASLLEVSNAAASRLLRSVEIKGYVERVIDDNDRRYAYMRLTPDGERLIESSRRLADRQISRAIERLGEDDARQFIRLLDRLNEILKQLDRENQVKGIKNEDENPH